MNTELPSDLPEIPVDTELIADPSMFPMVCDICKEKNLTTNIYLSNCRVCACTYCTHFASSVDAAQCTACCSDVQMSEQVITKTSQHYNEQKELTYSRTMKARQIKFTGLDWLFYNRKISQLSETELLLSLEYHSSYYRALVLEREKRRADHAHRFAGKKISISSPSGSASSTETVVKKTRTISAEKKEKQQANANALLETMLKMGMTTEMILKGLKTK